MAMISSEDAGVFQDDNPYLDEYLEIMNEIGEVEIFSREWAHRSYISYEARTMLVNKYAWAIPTSEALNTIVKWCGKGIVEIGAGKGYWAKLLRARQVDILAYDNWDRDRRAIEYDTKLKPEERVHPLNERNVLPGALYQPFTWTEVLTGTYEVLKSRDVSWRTAMFCWPEMSREPALGLRAFEKAGGQTFIYRGEGKGGCNADNMFFALLHSHWESVQLVHIPQYDGIHDYLEVFRVVDDRYLSGRKLT